MFKSLNSAKCASDHFVRIMHIIFFPNNSTSTFLFLVHEEYIPILCKIIVSCHPWLIQNLILHMGPMSGPIPLDFGLYLFFVVNSCFLPELPFIEILISSTTRIRRSRFNLPSNRRPLPHMEASRDRQSTT
jgi:hypothetical protein